MLWKILHEVEAAQGPLDLNELSRRLDIERSALDGMIQFWVRKGRLIDDAVVAGQATTVCASYACGRGCPGPQHCSFAPKTPRTITLQEREPGSR